MTLWYQRGATVLEAALVLPVLFLLLMATFEFGTILSAYETMVSAVREGARYAVAPQPFNSSAPYSLPPPDQIAAKVCHQIIAGVFNAGQIAACTGSAPAALATGTCPTTFSPPTSLTAENVYVGQCTVPIVLGSNCKPNCGVEVYEEVAVHRTLQLFWGWRIPLTAYAVMRSEKQTT
jgi:hypothetical protein